MNSSRLNLDELEGLHLGLQALKGYQDGTEQALAYLHGVQVGYLEILKSAQSDDPLVVARKREALAELQRLSGLKDEYKQKHSQLLSNLWQKHSNSSTQPSSSES